MSTYSIKDLEHLTGIKAHTIRIWEQRYCIIKPKRTDTNIRYYDSDDLKLMLNISLLNNNGYKISKIAKMTKEELYDIVLQTINKNNNYSDQISGLTVAMIDLNEEQFEKIMATNILQLGFENTMLNIVFPFLARIGFLWQIDSINPAQEHFITNLIRQKLIVAIDGQYNNFQNPNRKKYMLFLPDGELHEISLLFAAYLIKARSNQVIYLGQSMPIEDVAEAYKIHKPDYLLTIITSVPEPEYVQAYIDTLSESFIESEILLSGYQVVGQDVQTADNVNIITNFKYLIDFVNSSLEEV
ncbi:MerR family transcriptional regulator [Chondrinema litorale]|uniref:MerR family transcriptional regulator n=1 Tax=Chondrinema litorale TaxID=2994555 RepID=UPI002543AB03|nr:MerR family transcriptional regulator [Chondrinema litorale]UZR92436.1 MerR family transcriptional regulator [Chondrinema litorale]